MSFSQTYAAVVTLAEELADASATILRREFRKDMTWQNKADGTPVTRIDQDIETMWRKAITHRFPDHGMIGEEYDPVRTDATWQWAMDPIDGTLSFISGKPLFGSLIGIIHQRRPIYGIIDHPALDERWCGGVDHPTRRNGKLCRVRGGSTLEKAMLCATSPHMFPRDDAVAFERLRSQTGYVSYGSDCHAYAQLASGQVDMIAESDMKDGDYCALVPVIEAAGGIITDWNGNPLAPGSNGTVLACGDAPLHQQALRILASG